MKGRTIAVYLPHDLLNRIKVLTEGIKDHHSRSAIVAALLYRALGYEGRAAIVLEGILDMTEF